MKAKAVIHLVESLDAKDKEICRLRQVITMYKEKLLEENNELNKWVNAPV